MRYIDLHCDTLTEMRNGETLEHNERSVTLARLQEAEVLIQCCSIYIPTGTFKIEERTQCINAEYQRVLDNYRHELMAHPNQLTPILTAQDVRDCERSDKTGILLTIEDGGVLLGDLNRLDLAYQNGVRLITLTWNHENELGFPNSTDHNCMSLGLKKRGLEMIDKMIEKGIVIDVSHLSDGGFKDVVRCARKHGVPFVASHSNARALTAHPRNMTDQMIRELAECGGVMGLNFAPHFLSDSQPKDGISRIEDMVRHANYIKNIGGAEVLAIGSDFDGIDGTLEIPGPQQMWKLWDALRSSGFTERELDLMWSENAKRVLQDIL